MSDIYALHDKAFSNVSAYVVLKDGERVATIAFKFPKDGASRLYAYVHWIGSEMVRGHAGGYGYDKKSASVASAAARLPFPYRMPEDVSNESAPYYDAFRYALAKDGGYSFDHNLLDAGFTVLQAV
jgi:hypothetical protein